MSPAARIARQPPVFPTCLNRPPPPQKKKKRKTAPPPKKKKKKTKNAPPPPQKKKKKSRKKRQKAPKHFPSGDHISRSCVVCQRRKRGRDLAEDNANLEIPVSEKGSFNEATFWAVIPLAAVSSLAVVRFERGRNKQSSKGLS